MLDPTRYSLDAATVGFRKRTLQKVDWAAFNEALQTQTDSVKVRRELEETPISEIHVMGGERYGLQSNQKTNEIARQQRQMNGYPLRSFYATGGPVILPPKKSDSLLGIPSRFGHIQYTPNAVMPQQWTSSFTEPLNAPLDNKTILLGRAGVEAKSNSLSNPYKSLQFQLNMEADYEQIQQVERDHQERRSAAAQVDLARQQQISAAPKHLQEIMTASDQVARLARMQQSAEPSGRPARPPPPLGRPRTGIPPPPPGRPPRKKSTPQKLAEYSTFTGSEVFGSGKTAAQLDFEAEKLLDEKEEIRQRMVDAEGAQQIHDLMESPFTRDADEEKASMLAEQLSIGEELARYYLFMADYNLMKARQLALAASSTAEIDPNKTVYAEKLNPILYSGTPTSSSVVDLSSEFEAGVLDASVVSPAIQVSNTAIGIAYNDNGVANSLPNPGTFTTPLKFGGSPIEYASGQTDGSSLGEGLEAPFSPFGPMNLMEQIRAGAKLKPSTAKKGKGKTQTIKPPTLQEQMREAMARRSAQISGYEKHQVENVNLEEWS